MVNQYKKSSVQDRFFAKVFVPKGPNACWEWTASKCKDGYGLFSVNGKLTNAHRFSYQFFCGEITGKMFTCHKCDNPGCVNPKHLFLGTPKDNMLDKVKKNRQAKGSKNGKSKLKENDILEIRKMLNSGSTGREIAKQFGIHPSIITRIKHGGIWSHVI